MPVAISSTIKGGAKVEAANLRPALGPSRRVTCSDNSHKQFDCEIATIRPHSYQRVKIRLRSPDQLNLT